MASWLDRLILHGVVLKPGKVHLGHSSLHLLSRVISKEGVHLDEEDEAALASWPEPTSFAAFTGKMGWVMEYVPGASFHLQTLRKATFAEGRFAFTAEHRSAFRQLKDMCVKAMCLALPKEGAPYCLHVDASRSGLGAILMQDGRIVRIRNRPTTTTESALLATLLELAGLAWATSVFDKYLLGHKFQVVTDHAALKWLTVMAMCPGKMGLWALQFQQYDMEVIH